MLYIKLIDKNGYSFFSSEDKNQVLFGKKRTCDLVGKLKNISPEHLKFVNEGKFWSVENVGAEGDVTFNNRLFRKNKAKKLSPGDVITFKDNMAEGDFVVLEVLREIKSTSSKQNDKRRTISLVNKNEFFIGRDITCDILLDNPQAAKKHARIFFDGEHHFLEDLKTESGTLVNNKKIKKTILHNNDRIEVPSAAYIYLDKKLLSSKSEKGIQIDMLQVSKDVADRAKKGKTVRLVDNITMRIDPASFVGIVGGSGAGKSTFVDCINGRRPCTSGKIYYDTNDFYQNMYCYQSVIGYVPQKDILHENLPLIDSLRYTASMRIKNGVSKKEIDELVKKVIQEVKLEGKEHLKISMLSGGQKKRVSIAMELLSNPKIIFLDEPTSGLSPDLDFEIMSLLKELSKKGRTIVIITHAMENIGLCDKIAFLGKGGRLCFYDKPDKIFSYFKTHDYFRIFYKLSDEATTLEYAEKYRNSDYLKNITDEFLQIYK